MIHYILLNFFFFWVSWANCGAYAIAWRNGEEGFKLKMLKTQALGLNPNRTVE